MDPGHKLLYLLTFPYLITIPYVLTAPLLRFNYIFL